MNFSALSACTRYYYLAHWIRAPVFVLGRTAVYRASVEYEHDYDGEFYQCNRCGILCKCENDDHLEFTECSKCGVTVCENCDPAETVCLTCNRIGCWCESDLPHYSQGQQCRACFERFRTTVSREEYDQLRNKYEHLKKMYKQLLCN